MENDRTDDRAAVHADAEIAFASAIAAHRLAATAPERTAPAHEYYQTSLLSALMQGVYDGEVTIAALLEHGDFGLGTFNGLDGEMVVIDGTAYRLSGDGTAELADGGAMTPYAAVIWFRPDVVERLGTRCARAALERHLDGLAASPNLFYAVRVDGRFSRVRIRNVTRQTPPYRPLAEAIADQTVSDLRDVAGSLVGFRCPNYAAGIGVPGYHLHFIADDRQTGGHVLDYELVSGRILLDHTANIHLALPDGAAFAAADLASDPDEAAIDDVERRG